VSISPDMMRRVTDSLGGLHDDMLRFLRDIVAIPSYESQLGEVGRAVGDRMRSLGFEDVCSLYIDRRVTVGETKERVLAELRALPGAAEAELVIPM